MARVSAVRGAFGIGRELIGCGVVVEHRVSHPPLFENLLLSFSITKAWEKTSGTSTTKGASVLFFNFHWSLTILDPSGKGRPLPGTPALYALIIVGFATITLSISVVRAEETSAQSSYPLKSENAIPPGDTSEYLSLSWPCAKRAAAPRTASDAMAVAMRATPAMRATGVRVSIFCACCSCVADFVTNSDICISLHRKVCRLINVHLERLQLSQSEGSKAIGQWYRRYLRIGWESEFPSLIDLQD